MKSKQGIVYGCRVSADVKHKQLSQVTQKAVLTLLDDSEFTAVCSQDALKAAIKAKVVAEPWHFHV
jgi:hypothetical protein